MPCSKTPAEPVSLAIAAFPVLPPVPTRRGLQRLHDFEAATGLHYPLSTLHERRCRHPCKTRFRLAGSAFTGRVLNPLGHDERFRATSVLLSRTFLTQAGRTCGGPSTSSTPPPARRSRPRCCGAFA